MDEDVPWQLLPARHASASLKTNLFQHPDMIIDRKLLPARDPTILNAQSSMPAKTPFLGWRMVALVCVCTNIGVGFTFGAYGTFMAAMIAEFSASRSLASAGLSLMVACMGLFSPAAAYVVRRWSIRMALAAGLVLISAGWALMSFAASSWQFILAFGLLCGAGAACLIIVPPMTLVNHWFITHRGRAAGIVMVPVMLMLVPPLAAAGITEFGWRATALAMSLIALLLSPLTLLVIDRPQLIGQKPLGAGRQDEDEVPAVVSCAEQKGPTREPVFWVLMLCGGLYGAAGVAIGGHLVPFALGLGFDLSSAAFLLSIFGAAGLAGGFLGGTLADRIGGARTFAALAFLQVLAWSCLLVPSGYGFLALCAAVIGLCANAMLPVASTLFANVFGRDRFARVMGLFTLLTMPFNIVLPLLAGALYDLSGSYHQVFLICAALFAIAGTALCFVYRIEADRRVASTVSPAMAAGH